MVAIALLIHRLESLQHHLVEIEKQKDNLQNQVVLLTKSRQDLEAQLRRFSHTLSYICL